MAVADDLQVAKELAKGRERAPVVPRVDPTVTVGDGVKINAAQIVMGLAKELNTDKIELPGFPDIVARIQRVLADPMLRIRLAQNGAERVEAEFSEAAVVAQWKTLFADYGAG